MTRQPLAVPHVAETPHITKQNQSTMVATRSSSNVPTARSQLLEIVQAGRVFLEALEQFATRAAFADDNHDDAGATTSMRANTATACNEAATFAATAAAAAVNLLETDIIERPIRVATKSPRKKRKLASTVDAPPFIQQAAAQSEPGEDAVRNNLTDENAKLPAEEECTTTPRMTIKPTRRAKLGPVVQFCAATGVVLATHHNSISAARCLADPGADAKAVKRIQNHISNILWGRTRKPIMGNYFRYSNERPEQSAIHKLLQEPKKRHPQIPVTQLCAVTGTIVAKHESIGSAARSLCDSTDPKVIKNMHMSIHKNVTGKIAKPVLGKFHFRDSSADDTQIQRSLQHKHQRQERIFQFCATTGDVLANFENVAAAAKHLLDHAHQDETGGGNTMSNNLTEKKLQKAICNILAGRDVKPVFGKYYFCYASEEPETSAVRRALDAVTKRKQKKSVCQIDVTTGEIVATHESIASAARTLCGPKEQDVTAFNGMVGTISRHLAGTQAKPALGRYMFRQLAEEQPQEQGEET